MITLSDDIWHWIEQNMDSDPIRLRLAHHNDAEKTFAITQIECRQRTAKKLHDTLRRFPRFLFDSTIAAEQSTSDDIANIHALLTPPACRILDMTAGLGIDAIHLAGRASKIVICERDPIRVECAEANFHNAGFKNFIVKCCDSIEYINELPNETFDIIFIDPARRGQHGQRLFALKDCTPDVTASLDHMLRIAPIVIIKASPMLDITHTLRELHSVTRIIAVGTRSECKELIIECHRDYDGEPELSAITVTNGSHIEFRASERNKQDISPTFGMPSTNCFIYEAYPAVTKLGSFNDLTDAYGVTQIAPNTHLFYSENYISNFPGVAFKILDIEGMNKKGIKNIRLKYHKIDVTAKNFPVTSSKLTKRIGSKPSGHLRLFAVSAVDKSLHLIATERIESN